MALSTQRVLKVMASTVLYYFITFTALCWLTYLGSDNKHEDQRLAHLFFDAGVVTGLLSLFCSVALWASRRRLAVFGLVACLLWVVWAAIPRL